MRKLKIGSSPPDRNQCLPPWGAASHTNLFPTKRPEKRIPNSVALPLILKKKNYYDYYYY